MLKVSEDKEKALRQARSMQNRARRREISAGQLFDFLESAVEQHPGSSGLWRAYAVTCSRMKLDELALQAFENANEITPNDPRILLEHARFLKKIGRYDEGEDLIIRHIRYSKGYNKYNLTQLGDLYQQAGEHTLSIQQSEDFANDDFSLAGACFWLAATAKGPEDEYAKKRYREIKIYLKGTGFSPKAQAQRLMHHHDQRWLDMRTHEGKPPIKRDIDYLKKAPLIVELDL